MQVYELTSVFNSLNIIAAPLIDSFASHYSYADWAQEGGDPCLPTPRSWIRCTDDSQPSISSM